MPTLQPRRRMVIGMLYIAVCLGLSIMSLIGVMIGIASDTNLTQAMEEHNPSTPMAQFALQRGATPTPTDVDETGVVILVSEGDYRMDVTLVWGVPNIGDTHPSRDLFLIIETILYNNSSSQICAKRSDFKADVKDDLLEPSALRAAHDAYFPNQEFITSDGQCIDARSHEKSFLVYDISDDVRTITLRYEPSDGQVKFTIWLEPINSRSGNVVEFRYGLQEVLRGDAQIATYTPTPTATQTPTPTSTFTPSNTPTATYTPSITPTPQPAIYIAPDNATVNVRTAPSTSAPIITTLKAGDVLDVIGISDDGKWYYIEIRSGSKTRHGYVFAALTTTQTPPTTVPRPTVRVTTAPSQGSTSQLAIVIEDFSATRYVQSPANVRSGPGTGYALLGQLPFGEAISVNARSFDGSYYWYRLTYNGRDGWVREDLLSESLIQQADTDDNNNPNTNTSTGGVCDAQGATCPGSYTCSSGVMTCQQACACLQAGYTSLDRDHDGYPCESQCGWGQ